jgi:hypothetical protein
MSGGDPSFEKLTSRQRRQLARYRENMGEAAVERQLAEQRRCTYCGGTLPGGHASACRFYRDPARRSS